MKFKELTKLICSRKSTYAYDFSEKKIDKETINTIVNNAIWAPTHKLTQPWRFAVLTGKHQEGLGKYMAAYYRKIYNEQQFSTERYEATKTYTNNATLLGIIFQPKKKANLPEWEEIAAISCAVQNMWLSCTALNIGCYWDTSEATIAYGKSLELASNERFLGVFYMGYIKEGTPIAKRKRKSLSKKLSWIN